LLYQELQEKYEKTCEKREAMKDEMHQLQQQLEKTKADYKYFEKFESIRLKLISFCSALSRKWKEKSDLITELDNKVRRASENYQNNEKKLIDENNRLVESQK